jgi:hypothetical protein
MDNPNDISNSAVKPGWQSTEMWLTALAQVLGAVLYSGMLSPEDPVDQHILKVGGLALAILTALGYKVSRTMVKMNTTNAAKEVTIAKLQAESEKE